MAETVSRHLTSGLSFDLEWDLIDSVQDVEELSRGRLRSFLDAHAIWGIPEGPGLEWCWIDLLEWLSSCWVYLEHDCGLPAGVPGEGTIWKLRAVFEYDPGLSSLPPDVGQRIFEFRECHDLSRALPGATAPALLVFREGDLVWVSSRKLTKRLRWKEVSAAVLGLGNQIASRLESSSEERARIAIKDWHERNFLEPVEFAAIATGTTPASILDLVSDKDIPGFFEFSGGALEQTELLVAARIAGPLTHPEALAGLVEQVRAVQHVNPRKLRKLKSMRTRARAFLEDLPRHLTDFQQGYELAKWVRHELRCFSNVRFEVQGLIEDLKVPLLDLSNTDPTLEALLVWGPQHGPAILVNPLGISSQGLEGRRATLAHEICHLLVDRDDLFPLVEVLEAQGDSEAERRARAFAAELLVPQAAVKKRFVSGDPELELNRLSSHFIASREIIAWQARNSGAPLSREAFELLRQQVTEPHRFTRRR